MAFMLFRQVGNICIEIYHIVDALEVDRIRSVDNLSRTILGSLDIVEPVRIILLKQLIKARLRWHTVFLEIEST